ncbi:MAG TPA: T9SS type A sorting domain-containing protein [Saprospiraceae bacterium]|nr:T9SS type A sorting domain-containing protein [Saprospiraceae bacterium]
MKPFLRALSLMLLTLPVGCITQMSAQTHNEFIAYPGDVPSQGTLPEWWVDVHVVGNTANSVGRIERCKQIRQPDEFLVDVVIFNVTRIAGCRFTLYYDDRYVDFINADLDFILTSAGGALQSVLATEMPNSVFIAANIDPCDPKASGEGVLARLKFKAKKPYGQSGFDIDPFLYFHTWEVDPFTFPCGVVPFEQELNYGVSQVYVDPTGNIGCWTVTDSTDVADLDPGDAVADANQELGVIGTTLRSAIQEANEIEGPNKITARVEDEAREGGDSCHIKILSALPALVDDTGGTEIDATTQQMRSAGPLTCFPGLIMTPALLLPPPPVGLVVRSSDNTIRGVGFFGFPASGILITGAAATNNEVECSFFGANGSGVSIAGNASENRIGGPDPSEGNLISGNIGNGVTIANSNNNSIVGNFIGVDFTGLIARGNRGDGVSISNSFDNIIGGNETADMNVISANGKSGINVTGTLSTQNIIRNNMIGTDYSGTIDRGNTLEGILIDGGAHQNIIGGHMPLDPTRGNVISGNDAYGVRISGSDTDDNLIQSNLIGTNRNGTAGIANGIATAPAPVGSGVRIESGAQNNIVGGLFLLGGGAGNLISGNMRHGVHISDLTTDNNLIQNNNIGTNFNGSAAIPNGLPGPPPQGSGVVIDQGAQNTRIGGSLAGEGNLISGNHADNILVEGPLTDNNVIQDNLIGPDRTHSMSLAPAGSHSGVRVSDGPLNTKVKDNTISGHLRHGIFIEGVTQTEILQNFIGSTNAPNVRNGIYLGPLVVTPVAGGPSFSLAGSSNNFISRNSIGESGLNGILIEGVSDATGIAPSNGNLLTSNFIIANEANGIEIRNHANQNFVGGFIAAARNIISGNFDNGIRISSTNSNSIPDSNQIAGNYIGTDTSGTVASPNGFFPIEDDAGIFIGGTNTFIGPGNLISANSGAGIEIHGPAASGNIVFSNLIGLQSDSVSALGNDGDGILVTNGANNNTIGALDSLNMISFNGNHGVNVDTIAGQGNRIIASIFRSNAGLGINIGADGANQNDMRDQDTGPNDLQNYPELVSVKFTQNTTTVTGIVESTPNMELTLSFYANKACDPSDFGEGEIFLGTMKVMTDVDGATDFVFASDIPSVGSFITATCTNDDRSTSEFSRCTEVLNSTVSTQDAQVNIGAISLFPNPAQDMTRLELRTRVSEATEIHIHDDMGRLVRAISFDPDQGYSSHMIDLTGLLAGLYFVDVWFESQSATLKLLKL